VGKNKKYRIKADMVDIFPKLKSEDNKSIWNIEWTGYTREDPARKVGTVSYEGEPKRGRLKLVAEAEPEFKDSREMKTLLKAMVDWTFNQKNAYEIEAVTDHEDDSRIYMLQAAGFVYRDGTRQTDNYSVTKQRTSWTGLYLFIGIIAGFAIGVVIDMMVTGLAIGVFIGIAIGAALDQKEVAEQREVTGERTLSKRKNFLWGRKPSDKKDDSEKDDSEEDITE